MGELALSTWGQGSIPGGDSEGGRGRGKDGEVHHVWPRKSLRELWLLLI